MSSNINTVVVSGNLTRDVELKTFDSGAQVAEFGIAVNRSRKQDESYVDEASFFEVKVWGNFGNLAARKLKKGSFVSIAGRLEQERWETPDGNRSKVVIVADRVEGADFFKPSSEDNSTTAAAAPVAAGVAAGGDDIPF